MVVNIEVVKKRDMTVDNKGDISECKVVWKRKEK